MIVVPMQLPIPVAVLLHGLLFRRARRVVGSVLQRRQQRVLAELALAVVQHRQIRVWQLRRVCLALVDLRPGRHGHIMSHGKATTWILNLETVIGCQRDLLLKELSPHIPIRVPMLQVRQSPLLSEPSMVHQEIVRTSVSSVVRALTA